MISLFVQCGSPAFNYSQGLSWYFVLFLFLIFPIWSWGHLLYKFLKSADFYSALWNTDPRSCLPLNLYVELLNLGFNGLEIAVKNPLRNGLSNQQHGSSAPPPRVSPKRLTTRWVNPLCISHKIQNSTFKLYFFSAKRRETQLVGDSPRQCLMLRNPSTSSHSSEPLDRDLECQPKARNLQVLSGRSNSWEFCLLEICPEDLLWKKSKLKIKLSSV